MGSIPPATIQPPVSAVPLARRLSKQDQQAPVIVVSLWYHTAVDLNEECAPVIVGRNGIKRGKSFE